MASIQVGHIYEIDLGDRKATGRAIAKIDLSDYPELGAAWRMDVVEKFAPMISMAEIGDDGMPTGKKVYAYESDCMNILEADIGTETFDPRFALLM